MPLKHGYQSPRWSGEIADCSMPVTFDQYSKCQFGCIYCFAAFQRGIGGAAANYLGDNIRSVNPERVKRYWLEPDSPNNQFGPYIKAGKTIQWGGMSDPFCPLEKKHGIGLDLMRFMREQGQQISFSTKGVWWLDDPRYTELFKDNPDWHVKISIVTLDEKKAALLEPRVPSPRARLDAIEKIAKLNGNVTLRFRPFIIGVSSPRHKELIRESANRGAISVSTEFFCLEMRSPWLKTKMPTLNKLAGHDVMQYYRRNSRGSGYLRLNRSVKAQYVADMRDACSESGIKLYVSDAHFKEECAGGSCCGLPDSMRWSRGQFTNALLLCKKNGTVRWSEIASLMGHLRAVPFVKAEGFNTSSCERRAKFFGFSMYDYLRWLWNSPNAANSPYKYFEMAMLPDGRDDNGDVVYRANPAVYLPPTNTNTTQDA